MQAISSRDACESKHSDKIIRSIFAFEASTKVLMLLLKIIVEFLEYWMNGLLSKSITIRRKHCYTVLKF